MRFGKVVKTAIKMAPIVIPIVKKVLNRKPSS